MVACCNHLHPKRMAGGVPLDMNLPMMMKKCCFLEGQLLRLLQLHLEYLGRQLHPLRQLLPLRHLGHRLALSLRLGQLRPVDPLDPLDPFDPLDPLHPLLLLHPLNLHLAQWGQEYLVDPLRPWLLLHLEHQLRLLHP